MYWLKASLAFTHYLTEPQIHVQFPFQFNLLRMSKENNFYFSLRYVSETSFWKQFTEATSSYVSEKNNTSFSVIWEVQTSVLWGLPWSLIFLASVKAKQRQSIKSWLKFYNKGKNKRWKVPSTSSSGSWGNKNTGKMSTGFWM